MIWSAYVDGHPDLLHNKIHSLRPLKIIQQDTSLVFPFLSGLMGEEAWVLFDTLRPYATEYCLLFEPLKLGIVEAPVTPKLMTSLIPFFPLQLNVITEHDSNFATSRHHEEIIRFGTQQEKIKLVVLDPYHESSFPQGEALIETVVVEMKDTRYNFPANGVQCTHLWCSCKHLQPDAEDESWDEVIRFAKMLRFRCISFVTYCGSLAIPRIFAAKKSGLLQHVDIKSIRYVVEHSNSYLPELAEFIRSNHVEALELILYEPEDTFPSRIDSTPLIESTLRENIFLGICCTMVTQQQIDYVVKCASESEKLVRIVIDNNPFQHLNIDLGVLCDKGNKSWKSVTLKGVTVQCSLEINKGFEIRHLQLIDAPVETTLELTKLMFSSCNVLSFAYSYGQLLASIDLPTLNHSLTELLLQIDVAMKPDRFPRYQMHICNLQILALEITSFASETSLFTAMEILFPYRNNTLNLRGVELLGIDGNFRFSEMLIRHICCLCGVVEDKLLGVRYAESKIPSKNLLHLEYIMLHTELHPDNLVLLTVKDAIIHFLLVIKTLKKLLKKHLLSRLDLVCHQDVLSHIWDVEEVRAASLSNLFPISEGYKIEHDFYGTRANDSIRSQELHERTPYPHHRVSTLCNKSC